MKHFYYCSLLVLSTLTIQAAEFPKPYSAPRTERENVFAFTQKPKAQYLGDDKYEITFAIKGYCDVTVAVISTDGKVIRHLGSGVLGKNAPAPFQQGALKQTLIWDGKDDLEVFVKDTSNIRIRVMLGLKPTFEKRLGGSSPHNLPGYVWGLAASPDGVYVFSKGNHVSIRTFDHDGNYKASLLPPPANLPESKLKGLGYIEYEKGKRALHSPSVKSTVAGDSKAMPGEVPRPWIRECQPVVCNDRIYFCNAGIPSGAPPVPSRLFYLNTDGSTDKIGVEGIPFRGGGAMPFPRLASSPDGKIIYASGFLHGERAKASTKSSTKNDSAVCVLSMPLKAKTLAKVFAGDLKSMGSGKNQLNGVRGIDCDAEGRVYVADYRNNRVQIYAPSGKHLKSIPIDRPFLICVHKKNGAIYVQHSARVNGKSLPRVTKLASFKNPKAVSHQDGLFGVMALDSWSAKPRLWLGGTRTVDYMFVKIVQKGHNNLTVWEDQGTTFTKVLDFDDMAKKKDGAKFFGRWSGHRGLGYSKVVCDPNREVLYYTQSENGSSVEVPNTHIIDMKTGNQLGRLRVKYLRNDDLAFDKRGYLHGHASRRNSDKACVWRADPARARAPDKYNTSWKTLYYPEVPYDYGVEVPASLDKTWNGALKVKDQPGAKGFQDGFGVNMGGDIAVQSNIYYVPKMGEMAHALASSGPMERAKAGFKSDDDKKHGYAAFKKRVYTWDKKREEQYFIKREPGIPLSGSTIWTFDRTGELRQECAAIMRWIINGVQIDDEGKLYFVNGSPSIMNAQGHAFLANLGGTIGDPDNKHNRFPFTGTLMKTRAKNVRMKLSTANIPMERLPSRKPDVVATSWLNSYGKNGSPKKSWAWIEGAEWLYAGASPLKANGCSCAILRIHLDWYKRTFVPEAYRHSFGVLDSNGNLILHLGRYGNLDSANGAKSKIPVGGDNIAVYQPRFISGTDDYLVYEDWSERLMVLKVNYHAEVTVGIDKKP